MLIFEETLNHVIMKNLVFAIVLTIGAFLVQAQDKTIIMTESRLPYTSQTWFYSGRGNELQESNIEKNWDEGRRITSVAYTDNGWFVTMAKNTGMGRQSYSYSADWPIDWIKEKWGNDYNITAIGRSQSKWLVVMSQDSGYTTQYWCRDNWSELKEWYDEKREEGCYITDMAYNGNMWTLVASKTDKIKSQGYLWANSYEDLKSKIKTKIWGNSYNIHAIGYGGGQYLVVYGKYSSNNERGQNYVVNPSDVSDYIDKRWADSHEIAYIGGWYNGSNYVNHNAPVYQSSGLLIDQTSVDPSLLGPTYNYSGGNSTGGNYHYTNPGTSYRCPICSGTGMCDRCGGTGQRVVDLGIRGNKINQCGVCHGTGRCHQCHGKGKIR